MKFSLPEVDARQVGQQRNMRLALFQQAIQVIVSINGFSYCDTVRKMCDVYTEKKKKN